MTLEYDIVNAFDTASGLTFDDVVGVFAGLLPPSVIDTTNIPNGSLYIQAPAGFYQKQNGIWIRLDTLLGSSVNMTLRTVDGLDVTIVNGVVAAVTPNTTSPAMLKTVYFTDKRPAGSYKSSGEKGKWNVVALTEMQDPFNIASMVLDDFSLLPGTYRIDGYVVGSGKVRIFNDTTGKVMLVGPTNTGNMTIKGFITVARDELLELQYYPASSEGDAHHDEQDKKDTTEEIFAFLEVTGAN